jgi:hypothetical protein
MEKIASKLGVISFNPNKIIFKGKFMQEIDCAHQKILKIFSGHSKNVSKLAVISFNPNTSEKNFQNFSMSAIDFSHKITPKGSLVKKIFYPAVSRPGSVPPTTRLEVKAL